MGCWCDLVVRSGKQRLGFEKQPVGRLGNTTTYLDSTRHFCRWPAVRPLQYYTSGRNVRSRARKTGGVAEQSRDAHRDTSLPIIGHPCFIRRTISWSAPACGAAIARLLHVADHRVQGLERRARVAGNVDDSVYAFDIRIHDHGTHYFRTSSVRIWAFVNRFAKNEKRM
jgi:hypothetical protein